MMVVVYATRALANTAVAALPGVLYEHLHREGLGADDFRIVNAGGAAARIRRRGVRTERPIAVLTDRTGASCVPVPKGATDPLAVAFDDGRGEWPVDAKR